MFSRIEFTGDGVTTRWPVVFTLGYLRRDYVQCRVGSEVDADGEPVYRTLTWDDVDPNWVTVEGTAPQQGQTTVFTRTVPVDELLYDFQRGAHLSSEALDESHEQLMMAIHQMMDEFEATVIRIEGYEEAVERVEELTEQAAASAESAATSATTAQLQRQQAALSAQAAAVSAQEALDRMNGTIHKSRVFNVRASWEITADTVGGSLTTLPESYFPTRNHMMLFYNGVLCELKSASGDGMYQYSEVGSVDVLSTSVVLDFPVFAGDRFDMIAIASGVLQDLDNLNDILQEANTVLATIKEERTPNMIHMMANTEFVEGERPGLYHPVHKVTGATLYSFGLCNGEIYDAVSTSGLVETPDMTDKFVLGCSKNASDIGEVGGSDTHTAIIKTTGVEINDHAITIAEMPNHTHPQRIGNMTPGGYALPGANMSTAHGWTTYVEYTGGSKGHNHAVTDSGHSHAVTGKPKYIKVAFVVAL